MFMKKTMVFIVTMLAVFAFVAVDAAYSDMLDEDSFLIPVVKKTGESHVSIVLLGKTASVNVAQIEEKWDNINNTVNEKYKEGKIYFAQRVEDVKLALGIEKENIDYAAFKSQLL